MIYYFSATIEYYKSIDGNFPEGRALCSSLPPSDDIAGSERHAVAIINNNPVKLLHAEKENAGVTTQFRIIKQLVKVRNRPIAIDRMLSVTPLPHSWGFFTVVIFKISKYRPIEIRLFAFKLLGLNMLKYAN